MKKKYNFFPFILAILCCALILTGCDKSPASFEDLSTFPSGTDGVVHNTTALSTENDVSDLETTSEEPVSTEFDTSSENATGSSPDTFPEETSAPKAETSPEESIDTESETSSEQETETSDPLLEEASYYFPYYVGVYAAYSETAELSLDERQFLLAYRSILHESLDTYFSLTEWITREDGISLSLTPNPCLLPQKNSSLYLWMARCIHAFELITASYETDERWEHADSLKPQYHCHAIFARDGKVPWNIEPYRTETDFLKILLAQGNP